MWFTCTSVYGYVQVYYYTYACVHMCCMHMFVWTNVHMCCIARQKMSSSVVNHFPLLRQGLSALEPIHWAGWPVSVRRSARLCLSRAGLVWWCMSLLAFMWTLNNQAQVLIPAQPALCQLCHLFCPSRSLSSKNDAIILGEYLLLTKSGEGNNGLSFCKTPKCSFFQIVSYTTFCPIQLGFPFLRCPLHACCY